MISQTTCYIGDPFGIPLRAANSIRQVLSLGVFLLVPYSFWLAHTDIGPYPCHPARGAPAVARSSERIIYPDLSIVLLKVVIPMSADTTKSERERCLGTFSELDRAPTLRFDAGNSRCSRATHG